VLVQYTFGHNASARIASAEEKNILHQQHPDLGVQEIAAGLASSFGDNMQCLLGSAHR
jgi:hypothetical protein